MVSYSKGVRQGCILFPYLFNWYTDPIITCKTGLYSETWGVKSGGRNIDEHHLIGRKSQWFEMTADASERRKRQSRTASEHYEDKIYEKWYLVSSDVTISKETDNKRFPLKKTPLKHTHAYECRLSYNTSKQGIVSVLNTLYSISGNLQIPKFTGCYCLYRKDGHCVRGMCGPGQYSGLKMFLKV